MYLVCSIYTQTGTQKTSSWVSTSSVETQANPQTPSRTRKYCSAKLLVDISKRGYINYPCELVCNPRDALNHILSFITLNCSSLDISLILIKPEPVHLCFLPQRPYRLPLSTLLPIEMCCMVDGTSVTMFKSVSWQSTPNLRRWYAKLRCNNLPFKTHSLNMSFPSLFIWLSYWHWKDAHTTACSDLQSCRLPNWKLRQLCTTVYFKKVLECFFA